MASMVDSLLVLDMALALSNVPVLASVFRGRAGGGDEYGVGEGYALSAVQHDGNIHIPGWLRFGLFYKPEKIRSHRSEDIVASN